VETEEEREWHEKRTAIDIHVPLRIKGGLRKARLGRLWGGTERWDGGGNIIETQPREREGEKGR